MQQLPKHLQNLPVNLEMFDTITALTRKTLKDSERLRREEIIKLKEQGVGKPKVRRTAPSEIIYPILDGWGFKNNDEKRRIMRAVCTELARAKPRRSRNTIKMHQPPLADDTGKKPEEPDFTGTIRRKLRRLPGQQLHLFKKA